MAKIPPGSSGNSWPSSFGTSPRSSILSSRNPFTSKKTPARFIMTSFTKAPDAISESLTRPTSCLDTLTSPAERSLLKKSSGLRVPMCAPTTLPPSTGKPLNRSDGIMIAAPLTGQTTPISCCLTTSRPCTRSSSIRPRKRTKRNG